MKIIIAGAGAVGTHLAKLLSREKQDIILMDENEERLNAFGSNFDLMAFNDSPTSVSGLKEAGVEDADLFIAVTPDESRNVTACLLAANLGAQKTVARIDNYEYLLPKNKRFFPKIGCPLTDLSRDVGRQRNRSLYPHELGASMVGILWRSPDLDRYQNA